MDRRKKDELPKMQVGFIDFLCIPLYKMLADLVPSFSYLHDGVIKNRKNWQLLVEDPKGIIMLRVQQVEWSTQMITQSISIPT